MIFFFFFFPRKPNGYLQVHLKEIEVKKHRRTYYLIDISRKITNKNA